MGEVYRAYDPKLNRDVALKVLPEALVQDAGRLRRFELEARSASALNHPAIVAIYDLGEVDHHHYMTMELVEGQTLREILAAGAVPARRALQIAAQVADGLAKAHDAGIVHRDVKPENLMVSHDGFAKILDFGLAKLTDEASAAQNTRTEHDTRPGSVMGTVAYMSPEQAQGLALDGRSDQFSFGLVLYELLSGRRPFLRPTPPETLAAVIRDEPPPLSEVAPTIPAPVRWIVDRCLAKLPAERYASTRDLARDLSNARDHLSELSGSGGANAASRPRSRIAAREMLAWALGATALVALLTLWVRGPAPESSVPTAPVRFTIAPPDQRSFFSTVGAFPFAMSPDGRKLAFVAAGGDRPRQLWLRSFDALSALPIAGTEGAQNPFWSPDGGSIGFFARGRLKRVSIAGGAVATISEINGQGGGGGSWSRDDVILYSPSIEGPIYRVMATGGTPTPLTSLDVTHGDTAHMSPLFLPDGRHFLFLLFGGDREGIYVGAVDSPSLTRISPEVSTIGLGPADSLFFVRDQTLFAQHFDLERLQIVGEATRVAEGVQTLGPTSMFSVSARGSVVYWTGSRTITQPTWVTRAGATAGTVGPPGEYVNIALSHDGKHLLADRFAGQPSIWSVDIVRGTSMRETAGRRYQSTPLWAPDDKGFAFAAAIDTPPNLYFRLVGASTEERLLHSPVQHFPQSWSPDGRYLAYMTVLPKSGQDIWLLSMTGDRQSTPFLQTPANESVARISPDGKWLAYMSNESGPFGVFVTRFPTPGGKWQISTKGGTYPMWSRDGRELFYLAPDGALMAVAVKSGAEFEPGVPVRLFTPNAFVSGLGIGSFYDVAPDGRFLINLLVETTSPPAVVILDWKAPTTPAP